MYTIFNIISIKYYLRVMQAYFVNGYGICSIQMVCCEDINLLEVELYALTLIG